MLPCSPNSTFGYDSYEPLHSNSERNLFTMIFDNCFSLDVIKSLNDSGFVSNSTAKSKEQYHWPASGMNNGYASDNAKK